MKTKDFSTKISSSTIKENMNKMFGLNVNLEKYSREQLEDMRNKLRTRVFQQEGRSGINDLLTNEAYQKDKAMLALLNTRIKEMLGEDIKKLKDKMVELSEAKKGVRAPKHKIHTQGTAAKDWDGDGKKESPKDEVWGSRAKAAAKAGKPFEESAKPDFLDMDKDGNKKEPMKKAAKEKKANEGWDDMTKAARERSKEQGTGKFDKKETGTGTVYTRKASTFTDGGDDKDVKKAKAKAKGASESVVAEKAVSKSQQQAAGIALAAKRSGKAPKKGSASAEMSKMPAKELEKFAKTKHKGLPDKKKADESAAIYRRHVKIVNESLGYLIQEDEEGKAKAITAAGDMVNDFTSWMQRVGQYQTKTMIELADAIKADFGAQEAETFKQAVAPALSATLETLTQQREAISAAVAVLAGEAVPGEAMGAEPGMDAMPPEPSMEPGMEPAAPDEMNPVAGDEFGASDAAAGTGTTGREMRESKFARKLAESHSLMAKLAK